MPRDAEEQATFERILASMGDLIENVVVLGAPDYLTRGWLVYEYVVACLTASVVCDEVRQPSFAALRDWSATLAPIPTNPFRDSFESMHSNHINTMILRTVNEVLPFYRDAEFRVEHDSSTVTTLLVELLKNRLPPKKEHQPYLGEWKSSSWTDEDIASAFQGEIDVPDLQTIPLTPFDTDVPATVGEAVRRRYEVRRMGLEEAANPMHGVLSTFSALFGSGRQPSGGGGG